MKYYFFIALFVLSANISTGQTIYENELVKLKLQPPANWKFAGTEASKKNIEKIKFTQEQWMAIAKSNNGIVSQVSYYKYAMDSVAGFIPTIKITVRLNPAATFKEFKDIMSASAEKLKSVLTDFNFIDGMATPVVSGHNSVYYSCRYSITPASSKKFSVRTMSYNIPRGAYFISITCMDNESAEDCSALFNATIKSISITD